MDFLILFLFLIGVSIIVSIVNIRARIKRLEERLDNLEESINIQTESELNYQPENQIDQKLENFQPLIDYIKQQINQGVDREEIKKLLLANGLLESDIEKIFNILFTQISEEPSLPPSLFSNFIKWLKEEWLLKLGALLLLIGLGWFTTYAFLNNWIGPAGRITLGIILGCLFMLIGHWRIKNYLTQGSVFLVLGSTTILLTIFAARIFYNFFNPISALMIMFLSTAFVAFVSVQYNSRPLSISSLILASIAPLLTNSPGGEQVGTSLFAYLFVVILGAIWIVFLTGQRELTFVSLIIIFLYSLPYFFESNISKLLPFAYAFAILFFITNTTGILKLKENKKIVADLITAGGNGLFLLFWTLSAVKDEWVSLSLSFWIVVFTVGGFIIFKITKRREPFYVYGGVGLGLLLAATASELSGPTLTIAYIAETGIIPIIAYLLLQDIKISIRISQLLILPIFLSIESFYSSNWESGILHNDFFTLLILGLTLIGLGLLFWRYLNKLQIADSYFWHITSSLLILGSIYFYSILWLSLHSLLRDGNIAVLISLTIYTIIGIIAYLYGFTNNQNGFRRYGGALVGIVVLRLLFVDVWYMNLTARIITFFLIGALLMSTVFIKPKKKLILENSSNNE